MMDRAELEAIATECHFGKCEIGCRMEKLADIVWWHGFEAGRQAAARAQGIELPGRIEVSYAGR